MVASQKNGPGQKLEACKGKGKWGQERVTGNISCKERYGAESHILKLLEERENTQKTYLSKNLLLFTERGSSDRFI